MGGAQRQAGNRLAGPDDVWVGTTIVVNASFWAPATSTSAAEAKPHTIRPFASFKVACDCLQGLPLASFLVLTCCIRVLHLQGTPTQGCTWGTQHALCSGNLCAKQTVSAFSVFFFFFFLENIHVTLTFLGARRTFNDDFNRDDDADHDHSNT
jgi:hypothetical protein